MKNFHSSYKYPLLILGILLLAGGFFSYLNLKTGLFPNITFPKIKVIADAGQQPVDKMMKSVTVPLENAIRRTEGLNYIKSTTSRGSTELSVFLDWNMDINTAKAQIESYINQNKQNFLPNTTFTVRKMNPSILPVMGYSIEGDLSQVELKNIAKYQVRPYLSTVPGVADVLISGGRDKEYRVVVKPEKLQSLGIALPKIKQAIDNSNILQSNGYLDSYNRLYLSLTDNSIQGLNDLRNVVVKNTQTGIVRLKDLADIKVHEAKSYVKIIANGKDDPLIAVIKQPNANLIAINNGIEKKISNIGKILPKGVKLVPFYKQGHFVSRVISSIKDVLWIGIVLSLIVVVVFLRSFSTSAVVLVSIPISLAFTLISLYAFGQTFNIMTLGAIAAAIGLMIDDVVIVIEKMHKLREEQPKKPLLWAVRTAVVRLFPALIGSSLSTIVIFIPFIFMSGVAGAYFQIMAFTMILALTCSFFVTWLIVPVLYLTFLKDKPKKKEKPPKTHWVHWLLIKPVFGLGFAAVCVVVIVFLPSHLPSGFLPQMDEGTIVLDFNSPAGTSLEETGNMLKKVNVILKNQPEVNTFSARVGTQLGFFITEPNRGDYLIRLKDKRSKSTTQVSDEIRKKIEEQVPQLTTDFGQVISDQLGDLMNSVQPIAIKVFGDDQTELQKLSKKIAAQVKKVMGTADVFDGIVVAGPEVNIKPKSYALSQFGMSVADLQLQMQVKTQGKVVSTVIGKNQILDVRLLYPNAYGQTIEGLKKSTIALPNGALVPLSKVAKVELKKGVAQVNRENEKPVGVVTARLNQRDLGSTMAAIKKRLGKNVSIPPNYRIEYGGAYKQQQQSFKELLLILFAALLLVFVVVLFLFKKFKVALAIVFSAVFGIAGCFIALFITGTALNVGSYMGIIMIVGIIGENSIFTYRQYLEIDDEKSHLEKLEFAIAERLRPVLMTAFAAITALTPLALGIGPGAQLHQPLAIAVIGGFVFALPLLLVVLPTILKFVKE